MALLGPLGGWRAPPLSAAAARRQVAERPSRRMSTTHTTNPSLSPPNQCTAGVALATRPSRFPWLRMRRGSWAVAPTQGAGGGEAGGTRPCPCLVVLHHDQTSTHTHSHLYTHAGHRSTNMAKKKSKGKRGGGSGGGVGGGGGGGGGANNNSRKASDDATPAAVEGEFGLPGPGQPMMMGGCTPPSTDPSTLPTIRRSSPGAGGQGSHALHHHHCRHHPACRP